MIILAYITYTRLGIMGLLSIAPHSSIQPQSTVLPTLDHLWPNWQKLVIKHLHT